MFLAVDQSLLCLLQWAKIIIVLERTYSRANLLRFQEEYSVTLKMEGEKAVSRGLMVIKTSLKTKARQRKGAISNWKVSVFLNNTLMWYICYLVLLNLRQVFFTLIS